MYPFQTRGRRVELFRYEARYTGDGQEVTRSFPTREQAETWLERNAAGDRGTVTELDVSGLAWLEGLEVESFDQALAICGMGQAAYEAACAAKAQKSPDQLRADVDFISIMTGVELV